jgi:hypothetical protein
MTDRIQLEADRAGGYLRRHNRVAATTQGLLVDKIAGEFALDPDYTKVRTAQLIAMSVGRHHVSQAHGIVTLNAPTLPDGTGILPRSISGGIGVEKGRAASAGSIESKMLPKKDGKWWC